MKNAIRCLGPTTKQVDLISTFYNLISYKYLILSPLAITYEEFYIKNGL